MSLRVWQRAFLTIIMGLTLAPLAQAQRGGPVMMLDQVQAALNDVNLTPEQRTKIDKILSGGRQSARGMRGQLQDADPVTRRGMARGMIAEVRDQVLAVLTPEQAQVFNEKLQAQGMAAATQPAFGSLIERLYDYVSRLDLDENQKSQVELMFRQTRQQIATLRQNPPGDGTMPQRIQQMTQQLRQQLTGVLSANQQQRLRQIIEQDGLGQARGRGGDVTPPAMQPPMQMQIAGTGVANVPKADDPPALPDVPGVQPGEPAPQFTLNNTDGHSVQLSNFKGKIVLMVFGSYSSPSFRQRMAALEQLRRDYGAHINVLVVYTRENYPVGQWEVDRNKDEGVAIEQPTDIAVRLAQAKQAHTTLKITVPVLIDGMDDKVTTDYGGFTNAAVLIGRDGKVLARQKWFEPYGMRQHIDEAIK